MTKNKNHPFIRSLLQDTRDAHINNNELLARIEPVMRKAGDLIMGYFHNGFTVTEKGSEHEMVTQADVASEQYLMQELTKIMPEADIIAEESGGRPGNRDYCWVIDPLDGTNNFVHHLPYFCISVALTYKGTPIFGAIYQPVLNELSYAFKGGGAFLNGRRIQVSQPAFDHSVIVFGLPGSKDEIYKQLLHLVTIIAPQSYAIRHFGAVAMDLANIAAGRLDGLFFANLRWWDVAAGMLLVTEAGGIVTDLAGHPVEKNYEWFIAASPGIHDRLLAMCQNSHSVRPE